jgi:hypothetical protein
VVGGELHAETGRNRSVLAAQCAPDGPRSGDYGYSEAQMDNFGAPQGSHVYQALEHAADRNVSIRYIYLFIYFGRLFIKFLE